MDKLSDEAKNEDLARKLWDKSVEWVKLEDEFKI
jgi:hypothetical protein